MTSLLRWMMGGGDAAAEAGDDEPRPPSRVREWKTLIRFDEFERLPAAGTARYHVTSPEFTCFGHDWLLRLHPNGDENSSDGMIGLFLVHLSDENIKVQFSFCVRNSCGQNIGLIHLTPNAYLDAEGFWGTRNFMARTVALESLVEGALEVWVQMKTDIEQNDIFIPQNPLCKNILKMFMDEKSADVVFEVSGRTSTSPKMFYAHRLILKDCAPTLSDLCKLGNNTPDEPIEVTDVDPAIFHHMLYYIYGGRVADKDLVANAKEIIEATDKYGVVNLKLEAEACLVKSSTIGIENMIDHLLYAEAKNCALLKEAIMDLIIENGIEVAEKVSFQNIPPGLFEDLLNAMNREKKTHSIGKNVDAFSTMRISDLRRKLDEKGLDIDGSRKSLVATLREHLDQYGNGG